MYVGCARGHGRSLSAGTMTKRAKVEIPREVNSVVGSRLLFLLSRYPSPALPLLILLPSHFSPWFRTPAAAPRRPYQPRLFIFHPISLTPGFLAHPRYPFPPAPYPVDNFNERHIFLWEMTPSRIRRSRSGGDRVRGDPDHRSQRVLSSSFSDHRFISLSSAAPSSFVRVGNNASPRVVPTKLREYTQRADTKSLSLERKQFISRRCTALYSES